MPTALATETKVEIKAPPQKVWAAITEPDQIKRWFFGVDTETDWQVGSPIVHRGEWQGKPYEDKGRIVQFEPGRRLVHTHWSSMSDLPDEDENYQTVSWTLAEKNGGTELAVAETNIPSEETKEVSEQSWGMVLEKLKQLLES